MFWSWNGAPSSFQAIFSAEWRLRCPLAVFFIRSHDPPIALIPQIESGSCFWCPRRSRRAGQSVCPLSGPGRLTVIGGSVAAPRATLDPGVREAVRESPGASDTTCGVRLWVTGGVAGAGRSSASPSAAAATTSGSPAPSSSRGPRPAGSSLIRAPELAATVWSRKRYAGDVPAIAAGVVVPYDVVTGGHTIPRRVAALGAATAATAGGGTRADRRRRHDGFRSGHAGAQALAVHGRLSRSGRVPFRERGTTREAHAGAGQ